ncbi:retrovirus-related pol polyprotein from transposon TNT 1-94 [Tanacetum coccineum]|uniref:Retrovirus-related pol polyprotein from transposon TNT 1-94 n=1 Tax=Tanacetum coccineum TaxID=301880 RepID=A0ABQ5IVF2_9ASTR
MFSVGQYYDSDLEVAFRKHSCYVQDTNGVKFLWVEAVATACYTQNRSLIHTLHNKTPYELVHDKKIDLTFFRVFGALCYPTNDSEDLGKLQPTADIRIFVGPAPMFLMPRQISSGLVPILIPAAPYVPPTNKELEILFQPMFNEYLEPTRVERPVSLTPAVSVSVTSAGTPSSTTIDQDAPSPSHSPSSSTLQSLSLHQGIAAESTLMENNPFAPVDNDPFINVFAPKPSFKASSSGDLIFSKFVTQSTTIALSIENGILVARINTMADMNMPANDVLAEQAPAIAPPTRTDDLILPSSKWVPIGKSNCVLDLQKSQRNPIFPIALDEQCFNLHKDILRDALDITPSNDNNPFVAPPLSDTVIEYVNTLGYPCTLRNVSAMSVNALYQPWRAILSMINMFLTSKTAGYDRPRHLVLQIL